MAVVTRVHPEKDKQDHSMDSSKETSQTVLIQFPKDQILREPLSSENHHLGRIYPKRRGCSFCCFSAWFFGLLLLTVALLLITAGILFLVFSPCIPSYFVERLETRSFSFSRDSGLSSEFYIAVLSKNGNSKLGIYYEEDNSLGFSFSGVQLCSGRFPRFYQGHGSVTLLEANLTGLNVPFSEELYSSLVNVDKEKRVPLEIDIEMPVKIKAGLLKLPKMTVRVGCSVIMSGLFPGQVSQIESLSCKAKRNVF